MMVKTNFPNTVDNLRNAFFYLVLVLVAVQAILPILWMVSGSLKTSAELYTNVWGPPKATQFGNYGDAWTEGKISLFLKNSIVIVGMGLAILITTASLSAYALARLRFPGRNLIFWLILATMMVPPDVLTIPLFLVVRDIGLLNTRIALSFVYAAGGFGISVFLLRGYFLAIPRELESAAVIDGASRLQIFRHVILPLSRAGMVTVIILQAMGMWNDLYLALIFLRKEEMSTVPLGLLGFFQRHTIVWPKFLAGLVIITIPITVIYILGQRQFVKGVTANAIKG
jgi:ABC-type glycerol-3-phosphate transport system permease component